MCSSCWATLTIGRGTPALFLRKRWKLRTPRDSTLARAASMLLRFSWRAARRDAPRFIFLAKAATLRPARKDSPSSSSLEPIETILSAGATAELRVKATRLAATDMRDLFWIGLDAAGALLDASEQEAISCDFPQTAVPGAPVPVPVPVLSP